MAWQGVYGHDTIVERFRRAIERGRLASSFLFCGPPGIGKRTFALRLAQALLCQVQPESALAPCGKCDGCVQAAAGTHPDLVVVARPPDRAFIPVEMLIGDREHRRQEGLCHALSLRPYMGGRKIAVIDDADDLNLEGANCLLKTLEEPPPQSLLVLISTSPARQLPTIRSRCQLVHFRPLPPEIVTELVLKLKITDDPIVAQSWARHSGGSLERARELAESDFLVFRSRFQQRLAAATLESVFVAREVAEYVDSAGKEAAPRRRRLAQAIDCAVEFYRAIIRSSCGLSCGTASGEETDVGQTTAEALRRRPARAKTALACLDRSLEAAGAIDRNANQSTLIEAWLDDLWQAEAQRTQV
jgi:DNA polymerase-3 subunit delta'